MEIVIPANSRKEIRIDEDKNINLIIGRNCEVKIIDVSGEEVEVFVDENSVVDYITIKKDDANLNKIAVIGKNSVMNWIDCYISNKINAIVRTELIGRGSETKTISVIFGDEDNEFNVKNEEIIFDILMGNGKKEKAKNAAKYWSQITNFPERNFNHIYFQKGKVLKTQFGILRIRVRASSMLARQIFGWIRGIQEFYR